MHDDVSESARTVPGLALTHAQLGSIAVHLAATFPAWVRRRKTAIEVLDADTGRSRQSVDFRLCDGDFPAGAVPRPGDRIYVPVDIAPKDPLTSFSVMDEDGRPLSLLNTRENIALAAAGLSAYLDGVTQHDPAIAAGAFEDAARDVVGATDDAAGYATFVTAITQIGAVLPPNAIIWPLLTELAGGFIMLVPLTYEPDAHRLLKIELVDALEVSQGRPLRSLAASFGFASRRLPFTDRPIGWAESTHFEISEPDELVLVRGRLAVTQTDKGGQVRTQSEHRVVHRRSPMTLSVAVLDRENPLIGREDTATIEVLLRSRPGGMFLSVLTTALVAAGVLLTLAPGLKDLDGETSAAVLLAVPALLLGYLNRPGEHALATRLLVGIRTLGLSAALAALAAAVSIAGGNIVEPAPAARQVVDCRPEVETVGPPTRRREVLRDLDCGIVQRVAEPRVRAEARAWMRRCTWVSVLAAGVLLVAALVNFFVVVIAGLRDETRTPVV